MLNETMLKTAKQIGLRLVDSRYIGKMESRGRRKDVGVVLGAWLFEAVKRRVAVVLGEPLILMAFTWQLHSGVFGKCDSQSLTIKFLPIQVAHG